MEQTIEQRTQAVIDLNKCLDALPQVMAQLTPEQKEEIVQQIEQRKQELGLETV